MAFQYLKGILNMRKIDFFTVHSDRANENGFKLMEERFRLDIRG